MSPAVTRRRPFAALVLLAFAPAASAREVTVECAASVNGVAYYSDVFQYELGDKDDTQFGEIWNSPQERDFAEHLRRNYGATGKETVSCNVAEDGQRKESSRFEFNGVAVRKVQTGYVPKAR
ncbi:hypothetical protein [Cognatilysobacter lacus]|uniref:Uncharacterized protein n=1 Tax=Cognatilysobacter lacus TaxID=1643323 RepID=A0A5D8Z567_9GAMM|nr:hypothetical protein [Lysobacter lacus]TZF89790.1 hypothetical protein FW784_07915 [Lysobacter lacus]